MMGTNGRIRVDYEGQVPMGLWGQIGKVGGIRVNKIRPLTLVTDHPAEVLGDIWGYLNSSTMRTSRVQVSGGAA